MFSTKTFAVFKREIKERLFSKSFILTTILIPLLTFGVIGIQFLLVSYESDQGSYFIIAGESEELKNELSAEFSEQEIIKSGYYNISFEVIKSDSLQKYIDSIREKLMDGKITALVFLPDSGLSEKSVKFYSKNPNNLTVIEKLKRIINSALVKKYFAGKNISKEDLEYAKNAPDFEAFRISEEQINREGYGNQVMSFLFSFLLYMSLLFFGTMVMRAIVQEKANRIVEVILSSVSATELITGKIMAVATAGFVQMFIWLSPVFFLSASSIAFLPDDLILNISLLKLFYFLFNFVIGLITFCGLFAAAGSMYDNDQDSQTAVWPIMMLIMIPFFISLTLNNNPDNLIAAIASVFPFSSIIVMPARVVMMDVPFWQFTLSILINLTTMAGVFRISGKIYRIALLINNKKPGFRDLREWIFNKDI